MFRFQVQISKRVYQKVLKPLIVQLFLKTLKNVTLKIVPVGFVECMCIILNYFDKETRLRYLLYVMSGVILEIEGSVRQRYKKELFPDKNLKKGTSDLSKPSQHILTAFDKVNFCRKKMLSRQRPKAGHSFGQELPLNVFLTFNNESNVKIVKLL